MEMTPNQTLISWIKGIRTRFLDLDKIYITIFPNIVHIYFDRGLDMINHLKGDFSSMLSGNNKIEAFLFFKNPKQEEASYKFLENLGNKEASSD